MGPRSLSYGRLGALALAVLLAHGLILDRLDAVLDALDRGPPARLSAAMSARTVAEAAPADAAPAVAVTAPTPPAPAVATVAMAATAALRGARAGPAFAEPDAGLAAEVATAVAASPLPVAAALSSVPDAPVLDVPVYRTLVPPPFAVAYQLRRGGRSGTAELSWQAQGAQYTARLSGAIDGKPWLVSESVGSVDAAGLAPLRHTDRRVGRSALAVNFQREAGKVTFSGPSIEHALAPGMQDGLSWLLQLAAIAAADPSRVGPGGRVLLRVAGVRGEADVWTFVHVGEERLAVGDGEVVAVRLLREPDRVHDIRAEVWLDPARHYLPVSVRLSALGDAEGLWLRLQSAPQVP